ncbi:hypothetical protein NW762_005721 [Fusarium torreyae]|uniref:Uncharacterized protein n=1 Tax=Fusarium torreyae TaxID=1237075 RepID=A0A9W8S324_9HYPO|nr:hypothetical protein NW762_005721 [Fusarium torreyae]
MSSPSHTTSCSKKPTGRDKDLKDTGTTFDPLGNAANHYPANKPALQGDSEDDWEIVTEEDGQPPKFCGQLATADGRSSVRGRNIVNYHAGYFNGHVHWPDEEDTKTAELTKDNDRETTDNDQGTSSEDACMEKRSGDEKRDQAEAKWAGMQPQSGGVHPYREVKVPSYSQFVGNW